MRACLDVTVKSFGLALLGALGLSSCASEPTTSSNKERPEDGKPSGKTGYEKLENGTVVRHGAASCDPAITAPACKGSEDRKDCTSDAECTAGPHGKCITGTAGPGPSMSPYSFCGCVYSCATDSDCGKDQACLCGEVDGADSRCIRAFCRGDDDCDSGMCGYSKYFDGCGTERFLQCKSSDDKCQTNADCAKETTCSLAIDDKKTKATWACRGVPCTVGRPLVIDGVERFAAAAPSGAWLRAHGERLGLELSAADRARVADHYLHIAALEHASVASFARFSLGLLALGAPPDLLVEASRAAADEVRHAELCYGLANAYGGAERGPGPLPEAGAPLAGDVETFTRALVLEGCIGETLSALEARHAALTAHDAGLAATLETIADDELSHAVLAFRTLRWLVEAFEGARAAALSALAEGELALARHEPTSCEPGLEAHGISSDDERLALRRAAFRTVVAEPLQWASNESTCNATMSSVPASSRAWTNRSTPSWSIT